MKFKDIQATIEIDLSKSIEELWNNVDKEGRWGVNKARKENLIVEFPENSDEEEEFYKLYRETIIWNRLIPKDYSELKKEIGKLFLCKREGKIIAGAAIKIKENKTILFLNASNHEFLKFQPNNLLYWTIIRWSKDNGFSVFDLGGYQLNAKKGSKLYEVNRFKLRWGGEIKKYHVYSSNPLQILGRNIIRNSPKIKKIREEIKFKKWKRKNAAKE